MALSQYQILPQNIFGDSADEIQSSFYMNYEKKLLSKRRKFYIHDVSPVLKNTELHNYSFRRITYGVGR